MAAISELASAYCWTVTKLAEGFNLDRRTVRRRLDDAEVMPRVRNGDQKLYALEDAGPALFGASFYRGDSLDPDKLDPQSRRAWYQSENERVRLERDLKHLLLDHEVAREWGKAVHAMATTLDTLPEVLERDCALDSETLAVVEQHIDAQRENLYQDLSQRATRN